MEHLPMELRAVDAPARLIEGVVVPYDEVSYLTPNPEGERVRRRAFSRSIADRGDRIPLMRAHDHEVVYGRSVGFTEGDGGLVGEFRVNEGDRGDALLAEIRQGYLGSLSVGFQVVRSERDSEGVLEILEGRLHEVSVVGLPAYAGASMMSVRSAQDLEDLLAPFKVPRPDVDLSPIPPIWGR